MIRHRRTTILAALLLAALIPSPAATIRGKLVHENDGPAQGYKVTVSNQQTGRTTPATVGSSGMYYLFNIAAGSYELEIWAPGSSTPVVYRVKVVERYTDLPELKVR